MTLERPRKVRLPERTEQSLAPLTELEKLSNLKLIIKDVYRGRDFPFHDLYHVRYVGRKARLFGKHYNDQISRREQKLDLDRMEALGLVHDLNYLVDPHSEAEVGADLRQQILAQAGYTQSEIGDMERIVIEADFQKRTLETNPSLPAKILSDADSAFKVDPRAHARVKPKGGYEKEQAMTRKDLAKKIVRQQKPFIDAGTFFYTPYAQKRFQPLAKKDLKYWETVLNEQD